MASLSAARVLDKTESTGLGDLVLLGVSLRADTQTFDEWANGSDLLEVPYMVLLTDAGLWESGVGNYRHATKTFERATVVRTSTGAPISWPRGTKMVWMDFPASEIVLRRDDLEGVNTALARENLELGDVATRTVGVSAENQVPDRDAADSRWGQIGALLAPSGTKLVLPGGAVPAGWTRENQAEDFSLLGAHAAHAGGALGGDWNPAATFIVAGHTLTLAQMAEHSHVMWEALDFIAPGGGVGQPVATHIETSSTGPLEIERATAAAGLGQSHSHGVSCSELWRPAHKRAVVAVKL